MDVDFITTVIRYGKHLEIPQSKSFTIALNDVKGVSATLNFLWDKTRLPMKLTTDDVEQVSKQLDAVLAR